MRTIRYTKQFKKDFKRAKRRGENLDKLKRIIEILANGEMLPETCRDHLLVGKFLGTRECHLDPNWLLIYAYNEPDELILIRLGSHADLFQK
jgi:mRNA interferase YafQ